MFFPFYKYPPDIPATISELKKLKCPNLFPLQSHVTPHQLPKSIPLAKSTTKMP